MPADFVLPERIARDYDVESCLRCREDGGFALRFSTFAFTPVELVTAQGVERFEIASPEHIQGPLIETIVRELRGEGLCPSTGISAARTSRVMDEIMKE